MTSLRFGDTREGIFSRHALVSNRSGAVQCGAAARRLLLSSAAAASRGRRRNARNAECDHEQRHRFQLEFRSNRGRTVHRG